MPEWLEREVGGIPVWGWALAGVGIVAFVWWWNQREPTYDSDGAEESNVFGGGLGPQDNVDFAADELYGAADDLSFQQEQMTDIMEALRKGQVRERRLLKRIASQQKPRNNNNPRLPPLQGTRKQQLRLINDLIKGLRRGKVTGKERRYIRTLKRRRRSLREGRKKKGGGVTGRPRGDVSAPGFPSPRPGERRRRGRRPRTGGGVRR